jgi:catechol 2,3-dioxygenase
MDKSNGNGQHSMGEHEGAREARQAAVLSDFVDLLNAGADNAAALAERATTDADLRRLLTIARLLTVQPDASAIERTSARLRPWRSVGAGDTRAQLPVEARGASERPPVDEPASGAGLVPIEARGAGDGSPYAAESPTPPADVPDAAADRRSVLEVTGLDHVALPVSDLDRAVAFYTGVLGLRIVNESRTPPAPTTPHVDFAAGEARVLVYQALGAGEATPRKSLGGVMQFPHVALRVMETARVLERLRAHDCPFDGPVPSGPGHAEVHLWDPDGNQIDLIVPWPEAVTP